MALAQDAPRRTLLLDNGQVDAGKLLEIQQHHPHHQLRLEIEPLARPGMPQVDLSTTGPFPLTKHFLLCKHQQCVWHRCLVRQPRGSESSALLRACFTQCCHCKTCPSLVCCYLALLAAECCWQAAAALPELSCPLASLAAPAQPVL